MTKDKQKAAESALASALNGIIEPDADKSFLDGWLSSRSRIRASLEGATEKDLKRLILVAEESLSLASQGRIEAERKLAITGRLKELYNEHKADLGVKSFAEFKRLLICPVN